MSRRTDDVEMGTPIERPRTPGGTPINFSKIGGNVVGGAVKGGKAVGSVLQDFKNFLNRGNVVDLAVGIVMGAAFTAIVTSIVQDLFTPLIGLALQSNLENKFIILKCPTDPVTGRTPDCKGVQKWNTTADAQKDGAVTWNWGKFLQTCLNFIIIAMVVFFVVKAYTAAFRRNDQPSKSKPCPYCCKDVPLKATRCPECTSRLPDPDVPAVPDMPSPVYQMRDKRM
ncbi:hypothetical protein HK104_004598 [Borealophlyctis nickersoniae]|nr:hypothetical protein HK104_004598 [Borealophlyctis nickersoniae]